MKNISANITYSEATKSDNAKRLGIENKPTYEQLLNMQLVADRVFERARKWHFDKYGKGIIVTSFFRSQELNEATPGSSATSQHTKGEAMDLDCQILGGGTNKELFEWIKSNLEYDQLIWEHGTDEEPDWVHVSYTVHGNRKKTLRAKKENGKTIYTNY